MASEFPETDELIRFADEGPPEVKSKGAGRDLATDIDFVDPAQSYRDKLDRKNVKSQAELGKRRTKAEEDLAESRKLEARTKLITDTLEIQKGVQQIRQASLSTFQMEERAKLNKQLIDQEIDEVIGAGQAQAGIERAKGETAAEGESLRLAAQGQRLSGTGAKGVTRTQKILAATRAADARSNSLSRALGLEYEKAIIDRQVDYSHIQKSIAKTAGLSRIAFGIADATVRYQQGYPAGETKPYKTPKGVIKARDELVKKKYKWPKNPWDDAKVVPL